jgi:hypothetical protein
MINQSQKDESLITLNFFLSDLFERYKTNVPDVEKVTQAMIAQQMIKDENDIVNDHIAFRTLGVPNLGIKSFEKIFLAHGYTKKDPYYFEQKKLDAFWYAPPSDAYPRIFISELRVKDLSKESQDVIHSYTNKITSDPVDALDLNNGQEIADFFHRPLWELPSLADYEKLSSESEFAAWVIYNRYYLNHYTISVHELPAPYCQLENFNAFLKELGVKLNVSGGEIKVSGDQLLRQSSSMAGMILAKFKDGEEKMISGSYVEFAERSVLPEFASLPTSQIERKHRRDGFEAANADKIFESTYTRK